MKDWRALLKADPTDWLLEANDPSLRYRVLTELLDVPSDSLEALEARKTLMGTGPVATILSKQEAEGNWGRKEDFYVRSKYEGTVWNLILLSDLAADPKDERVHRAGGFILAWSQRSDGGFTHLGGPDGGRTASLPCLTGNMAFSLIRSGFGQDPRMLVTYDHLRRLAETEVTVFKKCPACRSGAVKVLKALAEVPPNIIDERMRTAHSALAERVMDRCLPVSVDDKARPEWSKFGFPLMWNTDLLEILDALARISGRDERMSQALDIILAQQDGYGRWPMVRNFPGRFLVTFERAGKPSRWSTFRALSMLKRLPDDK